MSKDIIDAVAQMDKTFGFTGAVEITGASAKHAHLFSLSESAIALTETAGKAVTGGMATALMTGSPLAAGAVGVGIALHNVFGGSSKGHTR